ncbi:hypothetical protein WA1_16385 [Scytonema hofmannii PCC 7110]|uniref:Uncharacterized protein n=1 Tax=Scytonema hofmannii PCC 7110 TaxID=128403 RepID=A0A139XCX2_9CYAN|nr:hypothetical protein [Scytonema hofmannii]KYC42544.1 hypothetical protein WA1_16385 [Scytonema hofmannii PCC 7110]
MKAFKYLLMVLLLLANFMFAQPSFADAPKITKSPEYKALTKEINKLRTVQESQTELEGYTPEEIENKLGELELLKYAFESGVNWGQCENKTGKTLAVYGPIPGNIEEEDFPYDAGLYFLANGQTTQNDWDCQGIYIPSDVTAVSPTSDGENQEITGGVVVKVPKGTKLAIATNQTTGALEFNMPVAQVSKSSKVNWFVPTVSQAFLDTRSTTAPTTETPQISLGD